MKSDVYFYSQNIPKISGNTRNRMWFFSTPLGVKNTFVYPRQTVICLWVAEQLLEVFLREATTVVNDSVTCLLSNILVSQVKVPLDLSVPSLYCFNVDFKPTGSGIFSHVICVSTNNHLAD
jgi:hypothetical protein